MPLLTVIRRVFASNLRTVSATNGERLALEAAGIHEPTVQRYLAWRRSLVVMVVLATIVSAALTTFRTLTEADEKSLCSAVAERLFENAKKALPAAVKADDSDDDDDEAAEDRSAKGKELLKGAKKMLSEAREAADSDDANARDELLAKGKGLFKDAKKTASAALKSGGAGRVPDAAKAPLKKALAQTTGDEAEPDDEDEDENPTTVFGQFADGVHLASLYAAPLAALAALCWWTRFRRTSRILAIGWAVSFFVPMLIALCPWSWWGYVEPSAAPGKHGLPYYRAMAEGFLEGIDYLITLLPTVLSLIPGVQRACLRVKTLLPESMLPGWFLVAAGPLYALFLLVVFVAVDQIASDPLFCIGMVLLLASPLVYVVRADVITRPLLGEEDLRRMRRVQGIAGGMTVLAGVFLLIYLTTREVFGIHLIGLNPQTSLLRPMDLVEYALEFVGRLLFMTVLGADLFMRMNLAAWNNYGLLMRSGKAADYDRVMQGLEQIAK